MSYFEIATPILNSYSLAFSVVFYLITFEYCKIALNFPKYPVIRSFLHKKLKTELFKNRNNIHNGVNILPILSFKRRNFFNKFA